MLRRGRSEFTLTGSRTGVVHGDTVVGEAAEGAAMAPTKIDMLLAPVPIRLDRLEPSTISAATSASIPLRIL
jgi:hypothetical protein